MSDGWQVTGDGCRLWTNSLRTNKSCYLIFEVFAKITSCFLPEFANEVSDYKFLLSLDTYQLMHCIWRIKQLFDAEFMTPSINEINLSITKVTFVISSRSHDCEGQFRLRLSTKYFPHICLLKHTVRVSVFTTLLNKFQ